jgi:hypothetical protein
VHHHSVNMRYMMEGIMNEPGVGRVLCRTKLARP